MKQLRFFLAILFLGLITACNFTEELFLEEDGSGRINIHFDGNELMAGLNSMSPDSTQKEEKVDTTLVFKELLEEKKDSIAQLSPEEQEKLKKLEPFTMKMVMDSKEQKMQFDLFSEFKNVSEVNNAFNAFQEASSVGPQPGGNGPSQQGPPPMPTEVIYGFDGSKFSRSTKILDENLFKQSIDSLKSAEMFLSGSTYTFKYHFPRRVKSTNAEGATFSMDGKTMIYEVNFMDMMKDPEAINIEVELED